jgi:hypothetical protein
VKRKPGCILDSECPTNYQCIFGTCTEREGNCKLVTNFYYNMVNKTYIVQ